MLNRFGLIAYLTGLAMLVSDRIIHNGERSVDTMLFFTMMLIGAVMYVLIPPEG